MKNFLRLGEVCLLTMLVLCFTTLRVHTEPNAPGSYWKSYISAIDGSTQYYGLYVPAPYDVNAAHPVIFIGHGFGGRADSSFSSTQTNFANANGFLLVKLDGRGNTFYDGVGEQDLFAVLAELRANYRVDLTRLYFEGVSMGATGAYRLGLRHPHVLAAVGGADGWADYRSWHKQWYAPARNSDEVAPSRVPNLEAASCLDLAENAKWLRMYLIVDTQDTTVLPENTYRLRDRLTQLGSATPETDYQHTVVVGHGGHGASYNQGNIYPYFLGKTNDPYPRTVTYKTNRLKYGTAYWTRIERFQQMNQFATITASVQNNTVTVTTANVLQYTLNLNDQLVKTSQPVTIVTNGRPSYVGPAGAVTLYARLNAAGIITGWSTDDKLPGGLRKVAGLEGPIGDAYTSRFLVAYGTAGTTAENNANKAEADAFCANWNAWMHAGITARADTTITAHDIDTANLILFGTADDHTLIARMQPDLPITVQRGRITVGTTPYVGMHYGTYFVYPNPLNPDRYVVISHKTVPGTASKDLEALPWYWPDYVVFDTSVPAGISVQHPSVAYLPDTFVAAGYFDAYWRLPGREGRPDLLIRTASEASYSGDHLYNVAEAQTKTLSVATGAKAVYLLKVRNNSTVLDDITVKGAGAAAGWTVRYFTGVSGGSEITDAVTGAGWRVAALLPDSEVALRAEVTPDGSVVGNAGREIAVTATSANDPAVADTAWTITRKAPLTAVTLAVSPAPPVVAGTPVTLSASAVGGGPVEYQFRAGYPDGSTWSWATLQGHGAANTCQWIPAQERTYTVVVYAREVGSTAVYQVYKSQYYKTTATIPTGVTLTVSPTSPSRVNKPITLTASASGATQVEYRFVVGRKDSAGVYHWQDLSSYGPSATCLWTPLTPDNYVLAVYARERGGTVSYRVYKSMWYRITT